MPDPIEQLEGFTMPTVTPLPAAEVRRRGNRIRRRNNTLTTIGGIAAATALAVPFAVFASGDDNPTDPPLAATAWVQEIPADFDLGALPDNARFTFDVRDESVIDNIQVCGTEVYSTIGATDVAGATWGEAGSEGSAGRTLALYTDDDAAKTALGDLREAVLDCPRDDSGELPAISQVVDTGVPGAEDAFVWTREIQDGDLLFDQSVFEVVQVGNALLVTDGFSAAGGPQAAGNVDLLIEHSAPVVDQMCVFSATGCDADEQPSEAVEEPSGLSGVIPDGFPLEKGLPTSQAGGAVGLEGPSHDLDLAVYNVNSIRACGVAPEGLPTPVDTLYAGYRSPAEGILRQLMTFASVADAQAYVDRTIAPFAACPEDEDGRGVSKVYEVTYPDLGDDAASSAMRVEVDGEPGVGYQVVQLVRVGQAVLQTLVNNDGDPFDPERPAMYLENSQSVVDEMN